jgi:DnaJ-class molecular chaperone
VTKDYYKILHITPDATSEEIRKVYLSLVKRYHPDRYGSDAGPFRDVREAYEVLSDPEKRRLYDRSRHIDRASGRPKSSAWQSVPVGVSGPFTSFSPAATDVEIVLSPWEASHGGFIVLDVPVSRVCPACEGQGGSAFFPCRWCRGIGRLMDTTPLKVDIPACVSDGAELRIPLQQFAPDRRYLTVVFRVAV